MYRESKLHMMHRCWRFRFKSEAPSIRFVRQLDLRGTTMLDIGANRGVYSIYLSRAAGPSGRVIAFEPQPELLPHLETVRRQFGLDNLTIVGKGLSSSSGTLEMRRTEVGSGAATVELIGSGVNAPDRFDIPVTTLDDYLEENPDLKVSFVKCDVEGHEVDVFKGGAKLLARDKPVLLFEGYDYELGDGILDRYLYDLGYEGWFYYVAPEDHKSLFRRGRGKYVRYEERADYPHVRVGVQHRNYIFLEKGKKPTDFVLA